MIAHIEDVESKIQEHLKQVGDLLKSGGLIIYISRSYWLFWEFMQNSEL